MLDQYNSQYRAEGEFNRRFLLAQVRNYPTDIAEDLKKHMKFHPKCCWSLGKT